MIMELLDNYLDIQKKIYEHFGYSDDRGLLPISDLRQYFWRLMLDINHIRFSENTEALIGEYTVFYDYYDEVDDVIYKTEEHTMILINPDYEGEKFLMIFDNKKEIIDKSKEETE